MLVIALCVKRFEGQIINRAVRNVIWAVFILRMFLSMVFSTYSFQ